MGCCWVGDGAIVGFFVVAIRGERVGDAGEVRFDEAVGDGVVEALRVLLVAVVEGMVCGQAYGASQDFLGFCCPCAYELGWVLAEHEGEKRGDGESEC